MCSRSSSPLYAVEASRMFGSLVFRQILVQYIATE
jgi:hypothetical protein